eukprot:Skav204074  [mRNA]  locus=scaffold3129:27926:28981:+ [translate_table: standard]
MLAPWAQSELDPGWLGTRIYKPGELLEFQVYDEKLGQHEHLYWWMTKGEGKNLEGEIELRLCKEGVGSCSSAKKESVNQFHTDTVREISLDDLKRKVSAWWGQVPAKKDVEAARDKLLKKAKAPKGPALRRRTCSHWVMRKNDPKKAKADPREPGPKARGEAPEAGDGKREKEPRRKEGQQRWFGKEAPRGRSHGRRRKSSSYSATSKEGDGMRKKSKKKSSREKRRRAERGLFGLGRKVAYGRKESSEERDEGEDSADSSGSVFQTGAPEKRSQQVVLMEYADHKPGRLASRMMQKMASMTSRAGAPSNSVLAAASPLTPSVDGLSSKRDQGPSPGSRPEREKQRGRPIW